MRPTALAVLALLAAPASADVFIWGQPGSYTSLQDAIDAAVDGDVLLLEPVVSALDAYGSAVIDGKGLHLVGLGTGPFSGVWLNGTLQVRNVPADSVVSLSDIEVRWTYQTDPQFGVLDGMFFEDCAGDVRVQRCRALGLIEWGGFGFGSTGAGLRVESCPSVTVTQSQLFGGTWGYISGYPPETGGPGLLSVDSAVALYDCEVVGGGGSQETFPTGGFGGPGVQVSGWGLYASGTEMRGGNGGGGDYIGCTFGGDGGTGLVASACQVQVLESALEGGVGATFGICGPGSDGTATDLSGAALIQHPGSARSLSGPGLTDDKAPLTFTVEGDPGDLVWVVRGRAPTFQFAPTALGVVLVVKPWLLPLAPMGVIDGSGSVDVTLWTTDQVGPQVGVVLYAQALVVSQGGAVRLSGPLHLLVRNT